MDDIIYDYVFKLRNRFGFPRTVAFTKNKLEFFNAVKKKENLNLFLSVKLPYCEKTAEKIFGVWTVKRKEVVEQFNLELDINQVTLLHEELGKQLKRMPNWVEDK